MRLTVLLVGGLVLLLVGCRSRVPHPPPPLNQHLVAGKWTNLAHDQLILGYDFADDGTFQMTVWHVEQPVPGRYSWNGERDLDLDYQVTPEMEKAYEAAVKDYREKVNELPGLARPSMLRPVRDELPEKETLRVGLSEKPPELILTREDGYSQNFKREE